MSDAAAPPRREGPRRSAATEAAVLDAAEAILAEEGYAALTMEAVARRAQAGKATLYRWWPGRAHLLLALYTRAKSTAPEPDQGDLRADLTLYLTRLFDSWRGVQGEVLRSIIAEAQQDEGVRRALDRARAERWGQFRRILDRAARRGELAPGATPSAAERRIAALAWYLLLNGALPGAEEVPALVEELLGPMAGPAA